MARCTAHAQRTTVELAYSAGNIPAQFPVWYPEFYRSGSEHKALISLLGLIMAVWGLHSTGADNGCLSSFVSNSMRNKLGYMRGISTREPPLHSTETGVNHHPILGLLQDMAILLETSIRVLALVDAEWQPLSIELHPDLLTLLMTFVSKLIRLHLLARRMPYTVIVQLYTLTYNCVQVSIHARLGEGTVLCDKVNYSPRGLRQGQALHVRAKRAR